MKKASPAAPRKHSPHANRLHLAATKHPWMLGCGVVLLLLVGPAIYLINLHWPFRYRNVKPLLENVFASQVTIDHYHRVYFPSPGFVASGLTLRRKTADGTMPPLGTAQHLVVQGGWLDLLLLRNRVEEVHIDGLHIIIPAPGTRARQVDFPQGSSRDFTGPQTAIGTLTLRNALLEVGRSNNSNVVFPIGRLVVHNMQQGQPLAYTVDMTNPTPRGQIHAHGRFGPIDANNLGNTPISGDFTFNQVQLSDVGNLHGTLASSGHFDHTLASIATRATVSTPQFAVGDGRPVPLYATLQCTVDSLDGDIVLNQLAVTLARTLVNVQGSITGQPKVTQVDFTIPRGHAQDLLTPFVHEQPPVDGTVIAHAHAEILPGSNFMDRLRLEGSFDIPSERLTNRAEEQKLSAFSQRAQNKHFNDKSDNDRSAEDSGVAVVSSLQGSVAIRNRIVSTPLLTFAVPGASVRLHGTYNLENTHADLTGTLRMQADLSHVTTGFRALLLKPFDPFFKHKHAGAILPVAVTGSQGNYKVSSNLLHDK